MNVLKRIYEKTNWKLLLTSFVVFLFFMTVVLPYVQYWTEEVKHLPGGPDTMFTFNLAEYYKMRMTHFVDGRRIYIILRWTFDVVWPIAYTFFYFMAISYFAKKANDKFGHKWLLVPLVAVVLDFCENTFATIFMATPEQEVPVIIYLMIMSSMLKWLFVGLSMILIVYLFIKMALYGLDRKKQ